MSKAGIAKAVIGVLIFVAGLGVLLYPSISGFINERSQSSAISNYEQAIQALTEDDREKALAAAKLYNESLAESQTALVDPFGEVSSTGETEKQEVSFLSIGEMMGYIQIPEIGIKSPIYEGTSEEVLQKGIGWLEGTSLPVGGESTNCVLSGHRGLPTAKLFTDIDKLEKGDEFFIRNSSEILAYEVIEIKIIEPSQTDALSIVDGEDRVTLLTCHPYMVNSQRLLVIGERIPYDGQLDEIAENTSPIESLSAAEKDLLASGLVALAVVALIVVLLLVVRRRRKKDKK